MRALLASLLLLSACKVYDPLFCDENKPCRPDSDRPFCDLRGVYPGSEGVANTCIPDPGVTSADASLGDGMSDASAGADASADRFVVDVAVGLQASCAVLNDGGLRCWGSNSNGRLGYPPAIERIGDDEHPFEVGDVPTGGAVKQVALGWTFMCLLYEEGSVRCIGDNEFGILGYGHTRPVGSALEAENVPLGEAAVEIVAGAGYTCARLQSGAVRCWGGGSPLGYADDSVVGDDETPADKPALEIGGAVVHLSANTSQTCAVLAGGDGRARCWGSNARGVLGLGHTNDIGDDETPADAGDVPAGGAIEVIQAFNGATCAILTNGTSRCWGNGSTVLGYSNQEDLGDDERASAAPALRLGGRARDLGAMPINLGGPGSIRRGPRGSRCCDRDAR